MDLDNYIRFFVNLCSILVLTIGTIGCQPFLETKQDIGGLSTVVEGQVTDIYTHVGIMGVPIVIEDFDTEASFWGVGYYDTIYTDSVGYYKYEFVNEVGHGYYVLPQSTDLYYDNQQWSYNIVEGKLNTKSFLYKPYRKLSIQIVNKLKKWPRFSIRSENQHYLRPYSFDIIKSDTILKAKFVPDVDIKMSINKDNDKYGNVDEYKLEKLNFIFNCGNRDTLIYIEY